MENIFFLTVNSVNINFENTKKYPIKTDGLEVFCNLNLNRFKEKFEYFVIDEILIQTQEIFNILVNTLSNRLIIFSSNENKSLNYKYYILKSDKSYNMQLESIIKLLSSENINHSVDTKDNINIENKKENDEKSNITNNLTIYEENTNGTYMDNNYINQDITKDTEKEYNIALEDNEKQDDKSEDTNEYKNEKIYEKVSNNKDDNITEDNEKDDKKYNEKVIEIETETVNKMQNLLSGFNDILNKKQQNKDKILQRKLQKESEVKDEQEPIIQDIKQNDKKEIEEKIQSVNLKQEETVTDKKDTEKLQKVLSAYEDKSHIADEKLDDMISKTYTPNKQNDDIIKLSKSEKDKKETKNNIIPNMQFLNIFQKSNDISKIKKETIQKEKTVQNIIVPNIKGEIGIVGGLKGVGVTFCSFKIARLYPKQKVAYIQYIQNELELSILKTSQEKGYLPENISIYENKDKISAYQNNDIVIVDYGYFDKSNKELLVDFERASTKYFVVNNGFNKYTSINNALSYSNYNSNFVTIFNMYDERKLINLQKEFKELNIMIMGIEYM